MPFGAPPYKTGVLLCTPVYAPNPGHEDQDTHMGGYFAVVHDDWKGVVTSPQRRQNEEHNVFLVAENTCIEVEDKARVELQEGLAYLAATKPPLVPLSPQRAHLQFERVLGLGAGTPPFRTAPDTTITASDSPPPPTIPARVTDSPGWPEDLATMNGNSQLKHTCDRDVAAAATLPPGYSDFELGPGAPRLFAVSGHSRVFRNRDRAVAVLQQTPGAELFWSCNPQESSGQPSLRACASVSDIFEGVVEGGGKINGLNIPGVICGFLQKQQPVTAVNERWIISYSRKNSLVMTWVSWWQGRGCGGDNEVEAKDEVDGVQEGTKDSLNLSQSAPRWEFSHSLFSYTAMVNNSAPSSHVLCNPTCPAQESHPCKGNESGVSKATKALEAAITKNKKIEYELAIDEIFVERNKKIAELAARFNKDVSEVRATMCCVTQFKAGRKPTLRNGVAHQCSLNLQEQDMFRNHQTHDGAYAELEAELSNGTFTYKSIDKVEQKRLIDQVLEARAHARRGPRATMKAAQVDGRFTAKRIGDEGLDMTAPHFMRKFEQWSCNLDEGMRLKNGSTAVRKDVSRMMTEHLHKGLQFRYCSAESNYYLGSATKNPKAKMDYVNYDKLRGKYAVELTGNVPRLRPATWNIDTLRLVRDGLMDGTIDFVPMTPAQVKELAAEQKARVAAGRTLWGPLWGRAERSDKHKRRGPRKGKATAKSTGAGGKKSRVVGSEEDSSSEEEDDNDDSCNEEPAVRPTPHSGHMRTVMAAGAGSPLPPTPVPSNPATCFTATQIDNTVLAAIPDAPVPASTAALVSVSTANPVSASSTALAPISSATPVPAPTTAPAAVSNTVPASISTATPTPDPPPVFRSVYAFVDDYGALQRNVADEPFQPEDETHMPPLPTTFSRYSGMNDYIGWDMGMPMGMGMGPYGSGMDEGMRSGAYAPSPMWPVLNMPPLSPSAAEKRGRNEGGDGEHTEPAKKRVRKENAVAPRGQGGTRARAMRGGRGRGARGAHGGPAP
ncbi:hypothetical protein B0H14DRAFT_2559199 [Mycena olivaceomarginata]|nr:hypothetical protein B0H14DRAFT_2559199 [Mycena olivaceomarginata]